MSTITVNDLNDSCDLDKEALATVTGGFWPYMGSYYSPYAFGYGGYTNQFQVGTFGFGVQAGTFGMQSRFDQQNASWMNSFSSGW